MSEVASAARLPASSVSSASPASAGATLAARGAKGPVTRSRSESAPAAFDAVARYAVVGPLVHVGNPGMEGEGAELEGGAAHDHRHAGERERRALAGGQRLGDHREGE
jgi:hypothetical protein